MIELEHLSRTYRVGESEVRAVDDVSLVIRHGEFVALMGPSGSGKSTLLNLVGCLDTPTAGAYRLAGEAVQDLSEDRLAEVRQREIGFIFQAYHLVPRMTAARNVELPMILAGVDPRARAERVARALEAVGLAPRAHHRPDQLSGGERQRVAIARAIINEPSILLADEPTGNLDTRAGAEIVALLERLNAGGLTVLLVTHDPVVGARARRILRIRDGRILSDGPPESPAAAGGRMGRPPEGVA
ncbi:MAG: macrolide ABC transporter ATP-binding protein [Candidatus Eisenbacteria bacterium RBG_16_71_46]|nr:MAG: macrolide ABC transporter ATP-binding protein [Candidatus Eisenbacteria bacterium RBG_16_71_46]